MLTRLVTIGIITALGCGTYTSFVAGTLRSPGEVKRDPTHGWHLGQMRVPIGGDQIIAVEVGEVEGTQKAQLNLALNRADKPLDCGSIALVTDAETVPLTKTQS